MESKTQPSVLLYGKSRYFNIFQEELSRQYGFATICVDPMDEKFIDQHTRLLIYDKATANTDLVTAFMLKNPEIPIMCLQGESQPEIEISYRRYSRIETSGLPQVLNLIEDRWNI